MSSPQSTQNEKLHLRQEPLLPATVRNWLAAEQSPYLLQHAGNPQLQGLVDSTLREFSWEIAGMPAGYPGILTALGYQLGPRREIVIAAGGHDGEAELFVNEVRMAEGVSGK